MHPSYNIHTEIVLHTVLYIERPMFFTHDSPQSGWTKVDNTSKQPKKKSMKKASIVQHQGLERASPNGSPCLAQATAFSGLPQWHYLTATFVPSPRCCH